MARVKRGTCRRMTDGGKPGWWCSLDRGHSGPCPARPKWWNLTYLLWSKGYLR